MSEQDVTGLLMIASYIFAWIVGITVVILAPKQDDS